MLQITCVVAKQPYSDFRKFILIKTREPLWNNIFADEYSFDG